MDFSQIGQYAQSSRLQAPDSFEISKRMHQITTMEQSQIPVGDSDQLMKSLSALDEIEHQRSNLREEGGGGRDSFLADLDDSNIKSIFDKEVYSQSLQYPAQINQEKVKKTPTSRASIESHQLNPLSKQINLKNNRLKCAQKGNITGTEEDDEEEDDEFSVKRDKIKVNLEQDTQDQKKNINTHLPDNMKKSMSNKITLKVPSGMRNNRISYFEDGFGAEFMKGMAILVNSIKESSSRQNRIEDMVNKFIFMLKNNRSNRNTQELTHHQRKFINDAADHIEVIHKSSWQWPLILFQKMGIKRMVRKIESIRVIEPTDKFKIIWDGVQIALNLVYFFFFSILMFFAQNEHRLASHFSIFHLLFVLLLFLDIFISCNSAIYLQDQIIKSRSHIFKHYLNTTFFPDLICLSSQLLSVFRYDEQIVYNPNHSMTKYLLSSLVFLRTFGLVKKISLLQNLSALSNSQRYLFKLFNQLFFMISFAHCLGIMWYILAIIQEFQGEETNWLLKYQINNANWYSKYIFSLYWAVTTMTTVGYGDITPSNSVEALFNTLSMILFSCIFAYSINNIGMILQEIEKTTKDLSNNIIIMQRYLTRRSVNTQLRSRIQHYLHFLASETKDRNKAAEDSTLSLLSNKLRNELTNEVNMRVLGTCNLLSKFFSKQTLEKIVFKMTEIQVSPNEIIFSHNDIDNQALFFIQEGCIEIYTDLYKEKTTLKTLSSGSYFGELAFFSGLERKASARSLNLSTLSLITRENFLSILSSHPEDFQRFKMLQEQIVTQNDIQSLNGVGCYLCSKQDHYSISCPQTHLVRDKQFIALSKNFCDFQERVHLPTQQTQQRKDRKLMHNLIHPKLLLNDNPKYSFQLMDEIQHLGGDVLLRIQGYSDSPCQESNEEIELNEEANECTDYVGAYSETYSGEEEEDQDEEDIIEKGRKNSSQREIKSITSKSNKVGSVKSFCYKSPSSKNDESMEIMRSQSVASYSHKRNGSMKVGASLIDKPYFLGESHKQQPENQKNNSELMSMSSNSSLKFFEQKTVNEEKKNEAGDYFNIKRIIPSSLNIREDKLVGSSKVIQYVPIQKIREESRRSSMFLKYQDHQQQENNSISHCLDNLKSLTIGIRNANKRKSNLKLTKIESISESGESRNQLPSYNVVMSKEENCSIDNEVVSNQIIPINQDFREQRKMKKKKTTNIKQKIKRSNISYESIIEATKRSSALLRALTKGATRSLECINHGEDAEKKITSNQQIMLNEQKKTKMINQLMNYLSHEEIKQSGFIETLLLQALSHNNFNSIQSSQIMSSNPIKMIEEQFDRVQVFSKFFPHNNINAIISKLKSKKYYQSKIGQKYSYSSCQNEGRRTNFFPDDFIPIHKEIMKFGCLILKEKQGDTSNQAQMYRPTVLSYGVNTIKSRYHPLRKRLGVIV